MLHILLTTFVVILPVVVLFSGMAMAPLLFIFALLVLVKAPRAVLCTPRAFLPNYKTMLGGLALMFALPLAMTPLSLTPHVSLVTIGLVIAVCAAGAVCFLYEPTLESPGRKVLYYYGMTFVVVGLLLLQERLLNGGLIQFSFAQLHMSYERFMLKNVNRGLCALVVFIWPLMLGLYLKGKQKDAWTIFLLLALGVMAMHSLSAKVGLIAGALTFFGMRRFPWCTSRAIWLLIPLMLLTFPLIFLALETSFFTLPAVQAHLPASALHRLSIWHVLIEEVNQKPWLGWGMNTTRALPLTAEQLEYIHLEGPPLHPHSPSLQIVLEQGIIGLLLTVSAFALLLREWVRMPQVDALKRATAGALIVAYVAAGVSSFGIWQHWWISTLWISAMLWRWFGREHTPVSA